jgi:hypothetical protein
VAWRRTVPRLDAAPRRCALTSGSRRGQDLLAGACQPTVPRCPRNRRWPLQDAADRCGPGSGAAPPVARGRRSRHAPPPAERPHPSSTRCARTPQDGWCDRSHDKPGEAREDDARSRLRRCPAVCCPAAPLSGRAAVRPCAARPCAVRSRCCPTVCCPVALLLGRVLPDRVAARSRCCRAAVLLAARRPRSRCCRAAGGRGGEPDAAAAPSGSRLLRAPALGDRPERPRVVPPPASG